MRSSLIRLGAMGVLATISGCMAVGDAGPRADRLRSDEQAPDNTDRFVTISPDLRRCVAPLCGGYHVQAVNLGAPSEYVSKLLFDGPGLDDATIAKVKEAPSQIVLRGHFGAPEATYNTRPFVVLEAYRGFPGAERKTTDLFYQISKRVPPIVCITTPCPNQIAAELNTDTRVDIDDVSRDALGLPLIQDSWLNDEIVRRSAIVAGALDEPTTRPGTQRMLVAHQIYLRLPARVGPCATVPRRGCGDRTATYHRDANRCVVFDGCVTKGVCSLAVPACPDGYTQTSWIAAPDGCPAYACDPSFAE